MRGSMNSSTFRVNNISEIDTSIQKQDIKGNEEPADTNLSHKPKVRLAVFDLDGTIIEGQSPAIMVFNLFKKGIIPIGRAIITGFWGLGYKAGLDLDSVSVRERIFKTFAGKNVDEVDAYIEKVCREKISKHIRPKAIKAIMQHNRAGDVVVLVSASFDPISRHFADLLGIDHQVSTRMQIVNDVYTGKIEGAPVEGEEKLLRLKQYANETFGEGTWEIGSSYADHDSDIYILAVAENPVAVNPKHKLAYAARKMGWEIQHW